MPGSRSQLEDVDKVHEAFVFSSGLGQFLQGTGRSAFNCHIYLEAGDIDSSSRRIRFLHGPIDIFSILEETEDTREKFVGLVTDFCNELIQAEKASVKVSHHAVKMPQLRETEMRWLEENKDTVSSYAGEWIAVEGAHLVSHSPDFAQVLQATKEEGIPIPFILFVPEASENPMMGL